MGRNPSGVQGCPAARSCATLPPVTPRSRTFLLWALLLLVLAVFVTLGAMDEDDVYEGEIYGDEGILEVDVPIGAARSSPSPSVPVAFAVGGGLIVIVVLLVLRRRQQQQQGGAAGRTIFDLRKANARQLKPGVETTRFTDVGGHAEAKELLTDVVDFLRHPERWTRAGVRLPRGVLLEGPPGGGKTLLARAVAGEAEVPVFVISASEFVEMFVGVGAARIRDLFAQAEKAAPCVIFIDELDAVGRRRGSGLGTAHDEREQTLNQLLVCLDGFTPTSRVVVIAATNRSDVLDRALLRPGRFDVRLSLEHPDEEARLAILQIHCRGKQLGADVDLARLARETPGASGALLQHLCNEAALRAVRRARTEGAEVQVSMADLSLALAAAARIERRFDALDALFVESTSQFTQPVGEVHARFTLAEGAAIEGRILWADAAFVKVQLPAEEGAPVVARLVPKSQIRAAEALPGTSLAAELRPDAWAARRTEAG